MGLHKSILALALALSSCVLANPKCPAPASSLTAQAFDLCFLKNETDDMAHPGVQDCYSKWMALPDSCETRTKIKTERCRLLLTADELTQSASLSKCITSMRAEGYFVNGCEYPFTEECVNRVNEM